MFKLCILLQSSVALTDVLYRITAWCCFLQNAERMELPCWPAAFLMHIDEDLYNTMPSALSNANFSWFVGVPCRRPVLQRWHSAECDLAIVKEAQCSLWCTGLWLVLSSTPPQRGVDWCWQQPTFDNQGGVDFQLCTTCLDKHTMFVTLCVCCSTVLEICLVRTASQECCGIHECIWH